MFHLELFASSIATGATTFNQLTYFTPDNILPKLVNGMQVSPDLPFVHSYFGVGLNLVEVRVQATSMLPFPYISSVPNNRGTGFASPPRHWDFSKYPIPLKPTEELDIFASQNAAGAQTQYVAVNFCDGPTQPLALTVNPVGIRDMPTTPGRFFSAHWTATTTLTAGQWTQVQPAFDQALYAGYYALLGVRAFSATGLFFRMFPAMGPKWRPGGICTNTYDQLDPLNQRFVPGWAPAFHGWGVWMTFYQNVPPQVEFFATAADTAQEGWFDMIYLGPQTTPAI
ncbi:MAG TPA: hypothetical protein VGI65_00735 [Steroidobacteraceae bacterium]|jgi:hypothetical protein